MPVHKTKSGGYKYGSSGKEYRGPNAKKKAAKQAAAIQASEARDKSRKKLTKRMRDDG